MNGQASSDGNATPVAAPQAPLTLRLLIRELLDFQMREVITTRMLPLIYATAVASAGVLVLFQIALAYLESLKHGVVWTLLGPLLFFSMVITLRVGLEFVMVVFRLAVMVDEVTLRTRTIVDHTETVVEDLPRIQFWKMGRKREASKPA